MIYLDHGATSFRKPRCVQKAVLQAMESCANPGRGGYPAAMQAAKVVLRCREQAADLFDCEPEQVVFTQNCTQGLNTAIRTLVAPGDRVVISGFEHNAVTRPLYALGADVQIAGRKLFDWEDTLNQWEQALKRGAKAAVVTHVSNVFGYILPVAQIAELCCRYHTPLIVDAAQSAGMLPVSLKEWNAAFIAMPGHKGLLGPQGTGLLLCAQMPEPLLYGGTGSVSRLQQMPDFLPDRAEAGTLNVPGIAGLEAGIAYLKSAGYCRLHTRAVTEAKRCIKQLKQLGYTVFSGENQSATVSFLANGDCETCASHLAANQIAVRAGLHCAPLAHESAGTLESGTVRISFGWDAASYQTDALLQAMACIRW